MITVRARLSVRVSVRSRLRDRGKFRGLGSGSWSALGFKEVDALSGGCTRGGLVFVMAGVLATLAILA